MHEDSFVDRANQAVLLMQSGLNCTQAVLSTYADVFGLDRAPPQGHLFRLRRFWGNLKALTGIWW